MPDRQDVVTVYIARLCPECGAQQEGDGQTHFNGPNRDCPNRGKIWAQKVVEVVPLSRALSAEGELERAEAEMERLVDDVPRRGHYGDMEWARDCLLEIGTYNEPEDKAKAAAALTNIIDTYSPAARARAALPDREDGE